MRRAKSTNIIINALHQLRQPKAGNKFKHGQQESGKSLLRRQPKADINLTGVNFNLGKGSLKSTNIRKGQNLKYFS